MASADVFVSDHNRTEHGWLGHVLASPQEWSPTAMLHRRRFIAAILSGVPISFAVGCRNRQHAHVLKDDDKDMVGSHTAGAETWKPLIDESVARMLGRSCATIQQASHSTVDGNGMAVRRVCFVGVENRSGEVLGDFQEQIYEQIDSRVSQDPHFYMISRTYVEAALDECRCEPQSLILPEQQRKLQAILEKAEQPFDYLLFARVTSGTTNSNGDYQRDYTLTMELLDIHTGQSLKEFAEIRKGYHKSLFGKIKHY